MKKLMTIHIPVAACIAFCACSSETSVASAPATMCWDEEMNYEALLTLPKKESAYYQDRMAEQYGCPRAALCDGNTVTVRVCVDNVEFK